MQMDYPNNPTYGQYFTSGGFTWMWDGQKWASGLGAPVTSVAGRTGNVVLTHSDITDWAAATPFLPLAGGTLTGSLNINPGSLSVNGTIGANGLITGNAGITALGQVTSSGGSAGLVFLGRDTGQSWQWYAQSGSARLNYGPSGDRVSIDTGGNFNAVGQITTNSNVIGNNSVQSNGVYFQNNGGAFYSPQSIYSGSEVRAAGAIWTNGIYWTNNGGWMYTPWAVNSNSTIQANGTLVTGNSNLVFNSMGQTMYPPGDGWLYFNGSMRVNDFQSNNNVNSAGVVYVAGMYWQNNGGWMYTPWQLNSGGAINCNGNVQSNGNTFYGAQTYANRTGTNDWGVQYGFINGWWAAVQAADAFYIYYNTSMQGGCYWSFCDERMKWNFQPVTRDCLAAINAIELKCFDFSEGPPRQRRVNPSETRPEYFQWEDLPRIVKHIETGFNAQQLREIIPEAVPDPPEENSFLSVDMRPMVATLIGAVQQLTARLEVLEGR